MSHPATKEAKRAQMKKGREVGSREEKKRRQERTVGIKE